ncbi:hypothetical protein KIPB_010904 [Kipferlia bialata]|uniref:Uncharacterized protein n=1 Tax=Kipferlia bialata TaxID=797122 RepID=A0A9K3D5S5_9EUKA|nr:hypothetical protein KIPB_010904 [Kipferlia bialata]|eukprot:g10904.t1
MDSERVMTAVFEVLKETGYVWRLMTQTHKRKKNVLQLHHWSLRLAAPSTPLQRHLCMAMKVYQVKAGTGIRLVLDLRLMEGEAALFLEYAHVIGDRCQRRIEREIARDKEMERAETEQEIAL